MTNVLFFEIGGALVDGQPFDALVSGKFTDMLGREIEFKQEQLADFVANTQEAIEATRAESGEIVGLPIDARNHEKQDAAGWIVGVELVDNVIRVIPKWTDIGRDLISRGIQRFFSATVDVANKVILGGTLTNWPATRDKSGRIQLRPIELSANLNQLVEIQELDHSNKELNDMAKKDDKAPEIVEQPEVKEQPIFDIAELRQQLRDEIKREVVAELQEQADEEGAAERVTESLDTALSGVTDVNQVRKLLDQEIKTALSNELARVQSSAGNIVAEMLAEIQRDQHVAEFAQRMTAGTESRPYGLPVGQEEVETFLLSLDDQQREAAESILSRVHDRGLIQFSEYGHGKKLQGVVEFPAEFAGSLRTWIADGGDMREFFAQNKAELGDMNQYNLDEYKE